MSLTNSQDRKPLEPEPPKILADMDKTAVDLYNGAVETAHQPSDAYDAQLARSKAGKVTSAAKVLEKAKNDPKVQKVIAKPKRKGRQSKKSQPAPAEPTDEVEPASGSTPPGDEPGPSNGAAEAEPAKDAGDAKPDEGDESTHDQWVAKETIYIELF